jgi:hypothetical protein
VRCLRPGPEGGGGMQATETGGSAIAQSSRHRRQLRRSLRRAGAACCPPAGDPFVCLGPPSHDRQRTEEREPWDPMANRDATSGRDQWGRHGVPH